MLQYSIVKQKSDWKMDISESVKITKKEYNSIPVYYCKHCGSLKIMTMLDVDEDYCDSCGSTYIGKASIESWIDLQQTVYKTIKPIKYSRYGRD